MPNPSKIFISSAYDRDLIPLRSDLKDTLKNSCHEPIIFEDDFFPWDKDHMETCLQKVSESDIFILLLNKSAGTYWPESKTTPTYMEFYRAIQEGKYIIAFLDAGVKTIYEEHIRDDLNARYKAYEKEYKKKPDYTIDIVNAVITEDLGKGQKEKIKWVDPFVWAFIFDVQKQNIWTENLIISKSDEFYEKVNLYLSDRLGEGIKLVPLKENIHMNAIAAQQFSLYYDYTSKLISLMHEGKITNWNNCLTVGIMHLSGGNIYQRPNTPLAEKIGEFDTCNAMTVYKRVENIMKLCGSCGQITPTQEYDLTNTESYVATAYNLDTTEIGYSDEKKSLYYTIKSGEYVLCFHYPIVGEWDNDKVNAFKREIDCAIMKNTLFTGFLADFIGGVQYEC